MRLSNLAIFAILLTGCTTKSEDWRRICSAQEMLQESLPGDGVAAQKELLRRLHQKAHHHSVIARLGAMQSPIVDVAQYAPMIRLSAQEVGVAECPLADAWDVRFPNAKR
ncbi:MAG: hypothetical protein HYV09_41455 [Deltaproteobacteria bacterium]|nr:hypothetical protein [Deltaproteobacteria bacterium]